jgi:putative hemolysin
VRTDGVHSLIRERAGATRRALQPKKRLIEPGERAMIAGVMRLGDRPVRAVMTPRREVDMVDLTADPDDIRRTIVESIHSRLPAHGGTPEEMLGVVQAKSGST